MTRSVNVFMVHLNYARSHNSRVETKRHFSPQKKQNTQKNALIKGIFRMERLTVKLPDKNPGGIKYE